MTVAYLATFAQVVHLTCWVPLLAEGQAEGGLP